MIAWFQTFVNALRSRYTKIMSLPKQVKNIPPKPGIYLFKDKKGNVLYIGKALNLKNRVKSYWQKSQEPSPAKQVMVGKITKIEYIITSSEIEAILLETNLIKKHQPPYNVDLKDDKYFLYIKITTDEEYPRVFTVRRIIKDKSKYFGPFTSARSVRATLRLLHKLFPHRNFSKIPSKRQLEYLQNRYPELLGSTNKIEYKKTIEKIVQFLQGDYEQILRDLKEQMNARSHTLEYESAARLRDKIYAIKNLSQKQKVISTKLEDEDDISLVREENIAGINLLSIRLGKLIDSKNFILKSVQDLPDDEIIQTFLERYYTQTTDIPKIIVLPAKVEGQKSMENWLKVKIIVPQKGKKRQLITMGQENAIEYLKQQKASWQKEELKAKKALEEFKKYFKLPQIPKRIEAFDISNIQGQNAVGSMVVFENGLPAKQWYRKFKIKTVKQANDPAMMAEIVQRRLKHLQKGWSKPDLIILDGGKGQLGVVSKKLRLKIPIVALAKQKEDIYLTKQKSPINLPKGSESLFLIQRLRDEAHRFAISFYRKVHLKKIIK